jgi:hypothetical protein
MRGKALVSLILVLFMVSSIFVGCKGGTPQSQSITSSNGNLQIRVTDLTDKPLQGARVVSEEQPEGQLKVNGLTDAEGRVIFNDIKSGNYKFYVSRNDYIQTEITVTITGDQTTDSTVNLAGVTQSPDDIIGTPGGPAYRANIHQQGVSNPWPPIQNTIVTLDNPANPAEINYRGYIYATTASAQVRNSLFYVTFPNVKPDDTSLPTLSIILKAEDLPAGITAAQTELQWHDGDPTRRCASAMTIQIPPIKPGQYTFNIDIVLNGVDYGRVPCTIDIVEEHTIPTVIPSTVTPAISSPTTGFTSDKSVTVTSQNGLNLSLSMRSTAFQAGEEVTVIIDEQNTFATENDVSTAKKWPLRGLTLGPCGTINYPMGLAFFQGYYTLTNISEAAPLILYDPYAILHCPMILSSISEYRFEPSSDIASVFGSCDPNPCITNFKISSELTVKGYWSSGLTTQFSIFPAGVYTVVGGDEWGSLAILHFAVQ